MSGILAVSQNPFYRLYVNTPEYRLEGRIAQLASGSSLIVCNFAEAARILYHAPRMLHTLAFIEIESGLYITLFLQTLPQRHCIF
jgi:hypothetical protein